MLKQWAMNPPTDPTEPRQLELQIGADTKIALNADGTLDLNEEMSFEDWKEGLKMWKWMQDKLKLGFSAYVSFGRRKFKEQCDEALTQLEFDMQIVTTAVAIDSIPEAMRHDNLGADHYVALARSDISTKEKTKWAKIASDQNLSAPQLKASIKAGEVVDPSVVRQQNTGIVSPHGLRMEYDIWLRRVKGYAGIAKMKDEEIDLIDGEFLPVYALGKFIADLKEKRAAKKAKAGKKKPTKKKK